LCTRLLLRLVVDESFVVDEVTWPPDGAVGRMPTQLLEAAMATNEFTSSCVVRPNRFMVSRDKRAAASLLLIPPSCGGEARELLGEASTEFGGLLRLRSTTKLLLLLWC
jgi:hypothetical protein